jgi:hypothetical protein
MPFTALIVYNRQGKLLLSRIFEDRYCSAEASSILELKVLEHARIYFGASSSSGSFSEKHCFALTDLRFVLEAVGSLYFVIGGRDDIDEIVLSDILDTLKQAVGDQLEGKVTEVSLLDPDNYGKVSVVIDEIICDGVVESLDLDTIQKMSKLKSLY